MAHIAGIFLWNYFTVYKCDTHNNNNTTTTATTITIATTIIKNNNKTGHL